jgi:predicted DNA-binding transcriptional regulator AlpA
VVFEFISIYMLLLLLIGALMKLLDSNEVCDLLGISKSTLYRWCGVSEEPAGLGLSDAQKKFAGLGLGNAHKTLTGMSGMGLRDALNQRILGGEETPSDFPRPFKIGRSFKWKDAEIMAWLETRRV